MQTVTIDLREQVIEGVMWFRGRAGQLSFPSEICKSTVVPGATLASAASAFGILNARLLPHFCTLVFIFAFRPNIH